MPEVVVTPDQRAEGEATMASLADVAFETDYDTAVLVWWRTPSGQVQPVIWPMNLHVHGNDCGRA